MPAKNDEERMVERHKALEDKRKESKARSREYYRRLRDAGKVQD